MQNQHDMPLAERHAPRSDCADVRVAASWRDGRAGIAAIVLAPDGRQLGAVARMIACSGANVGAAHAIVLGLEEAAARGIASVEVRTCSDLCTRWLASGCATRDRAARDLVRRIRARCAEFVVALVVAVPSDEVRAARTLAQRALAAVEQA